MTTSLPLGAESMGCNWWGPWCPAEREIQNMSWTCKHKEAEGEAEKTQGDGLYRMRIYFHSQSPVAVVHRKPHQRHLAVGKQADRTCQRKVKNSQIAAAFAESHRIYQTTFHFADTETQPGLKEGKNPQTA